MKISKNRLHHLTRPRHPAFSAIAPRLSIFTIRHYREGSVSDPQELFRKSENLTFPSGELDHASKPSTFRRPDQITSKAPVPTRLSNRTLLALPVQLGRWEIPYHNLIVLQRDANDTVCLSQFTNNSTDRVVGGLFLLILGYRSPGRGDAELVTFVETRTGRNPGCPCQWRA